MSPSAEENFKLIESLLWTPEEGLFLLDGHIARLEKSASFFKFRFDGPRIRVALETASGDADAPLKIRLLLSRNGELETSSAPIGPPPEKQPLVRIHPEPVNSDDIFLRHKTTNRTRCDAAIKQCASEGIYDLVFINEKGELTEGAWNNIMIEKDGALYTPPEECGLLPGVFRQLLLDEKKATLKILRPEDIASADKIFFCNSVRKMVEVTLKNN